MAGPKSPRTLCQAVRGRQALRRCFSWDSLYSTAERRATSDGNPETEPQSLG